MLRILFLKKKFAKGETSGVKFNEEKKLNNRVDFLRNKFEVLEGKKTGQGENEDYISKSLTSWSVQKEAGTNRLEGDNSLLSNSLYKNEIHKGSLGGVKSGTSEKDDMSMRLNARVLEYVGQGSRLPVNQIAMMEQEIEIRESKWDGFIGQSDLGNCTTNFQDDVDSDVGDMARFMVEDAISDTSQDPGVERINEVDTSLDQEQFAVEQLFGEKVMEEGKEGNSKLISK